ncbi:MAG: hypothetical protein ACM3S4_10590, partial [Burkholderiales bacterium]
TALSEMGQQLSIAGLGTKIAPPVLEGELCQKCNRSIDNVDSDIVLTFDRSCDTSYNISFTATVSGSYTNGGTIGAALGVTLGASKSYSLGSGCSITVPKGKHYLIKYRPIYYKYKVVETEYLEGYVPGIGWHRMVMGTKTCYVNVFSHWDFTAVVD